MNHDLELVDFYGTKLVEAIHKGDNYAIAFYALEVYDHAIKAKPSLLTKKQTEFRNKRKAEELRQVSELLTKHAQRKEIK